MRNHINVRMDVGTVAGIIPVTVHYDPDMDRTTVRHASNDLVFTIPGDHSPVIIAVMVMEVSTKNIPYVGKQDPVTDELRLLTGMNYDKIYMN